MRASRFGIAALAVFTVGGLALLDQPHPAASAAAAPALAPYRIGYTSDDTTSLMAIQPGGREFVVLREGSGVDFSPSGNGSATAASTGLVWVSNRTAAPGASRNTGQLYFQPDGGSPVKVTNNGPVDSAPALSPDGKQVAFAAEQAGGVTNIWVIGTDGAGPRQLTTDNATDTSPSWSPDGTKIAFSSTKDDPAGDIYTMPVAGGPATRITTDPAGDTQPAWSPDGTRIAFTTTRFHATGDIALVAATGGAVTQAIPGDPGDSAEPAWSPDGTRIAFSSHRSNNPLGAIFQVVLAGHAVTSVAADAGLGDTHPTWLAVATTVSTAAVVRPAAAPAATLADEVVFTQLHNGSSANVFSADASGQDRRNLTNNPGIDDTEPAFSADGAKLAYTESDDEGESRVMVADANGANPHRLTSAAPGSGSESNPAWSPDGTMIALARSQGEGGSVVQIVRVTDGALLGQIPAPDQLSTSDIQPTWSPDGTHLAFQRQAFQITTTPVTDNINPAAVSRQQGAGTSYDVSEIVHTPKVPASPDILLLIDGTGSMGTPIGSVRDNMLSVIDQIRATQPDAHFGVAVFRDLDADGVNLGFSVPMQPAAVDSQAARDQIQSVLGSIATSDPATGNGYGGDTPEDWIYALHQISTGAVTFRPAATKMIVLISDATSHDPSPDPANLPSEGFPTYTEAQATSALQAAGVRVIGVPIADGSADGGLDGTGQATRITTATNGVLEPGSDPTQVSGAIAAGIGNLPVTVTPTVTHCDAGLSVSFNPSGSDTVAGGADATFTESVHVDPAAAVGSTLGCTVEYRLNGETRARDGYTETVTVQVSDPVLPEVQLGNITTGATSPAGAVVNYVATATDSSGSPLTPVCQPPSGSTFPVGSTTVTCTATDAAGNVGSAAATVTVLPSEGGTGIWVATLSPQPDGQLSIPDQLDVSVSLGGPCAGGGDQAPDYSPDGKSLVFAHQGAICVSGVDGSNARRVDQNTPEGTFFATPAWSPDGALIAFNDEPDGPAPSVYTVPAAGGTATALIATPGGATQPAFQRQPDLLVTATADPAAVAFNGNSSLAFTVTNRGSVPEPNTLLALTIPAGLRADQFSTATGSCDLGSATCVLGTLAPRQTVTVQLAVTGVVAGAQMVAASARGDLAAANPQDGAAQVTVTVAAKIGPPPPPGKGDLSLSTGAGPNPDYVGGDAIVITYTVHNAAPVAMPAVALTTTLPAALGKPTSVSPASCRADGTGCDLGALQPNQTVQVRYTLAPVAAVNATETGTITTTGPDTDPADNTASAPIVVRQPLLLVDPTIGPEGFVARASGAGFPPGATVHLTWSVGISATPGLVTVRPDGTFGAQVLVFRHDQLGPRQLVATAAGGATFGPVSSPSFLVVPSGVEPPFLDNPN